MVWLSVIYFLLGGLVTVVLAFRLRRGTSVVAWEAADDVDADSDGIGGEVVRLRRLFLAFRVDAVGDRRRFERDLGDIRRTVNVLEHRLDSLERGLVVARAKDELAIFERNLALAEGPAASRAS